MSNMGCPGCVAMEGLHSAAGGRQPKRDVWAWGAMVQLAPFEGSASYQDLTQDPCRPDLLG